MVSMLVWYLCCYGIHVAIFLQVRWHLEGVDGNCSDPSVHPLPRFGDHYMLYVLLWYLCLYGYRSDDIWRVLMVIDLILVFILCLVLVIITCYLCCYGIYVAMGSMLLWYLSCYGYRSDDIWRVLMVIAVILAFILSLVLVIGTG